MNSKKTNDLVKITFSKEGILNLNRAIYRYNQRGMNCIDAELCSNSRVFPNVCVPIAGLLSFYKNKEKGIEVNILNKMEYEKDYVMKTLFWHPIAVEDANEIDLLYPFDRVWQFCSPEGVGRITTAFIDKIRTSDRVERGILQGIEWCINETLDNVLQHANSGLGFIMGQIHKDSKRLAISVFDYGRGILQSFMDSNFTPCPRTPKDAITLALQEKTTRDRNVGQGNGMWGLAQLVLNNGGILNVASGGQHICVQNGNCSIPSNYFDLGKGHGTTLVDFQLDYGREIDIDSILGKNRANLWLEEHEEGVNSLVFYVAKESDGTGTRQAAERFRNKIVNSYTESPCCITIDFRDVRFVSSSYADELIGKLLLLFGFVNFLNIFKLCNVDSSYKTTINRSVEQRLACEYYDETPPEYGDEV